MVGLQTSVDLMRRRATRGAQQSRDQPQVRKQHLAFTINYQTALGSKFMALAGGQPSEVSDCKSPPSCRCCWLGPAALGCGGRQEDSSPALWALRPLLLVPVKKAPPDKRAEWLWQEKPQKVVRSAVWLLWSDGRNGGGGRRS